MPLIIIKFDQTLDKEGQYLLNTELDTIGNVSPFELLGALRYFEKQVWLRITKAEQDSQEKSKEICCPQLLITNSQAEINQMIEKGWRVVSITPHYVSTGSSYATKGEFCILFEKQL